MSGTVSGGKAAAATNKAKYGADFYAKIGALGGKKGTTGGFASFTQCSCKTFAEPHRIARCAGQKGGRISKRRKKQA